MRHRILMMVLPLVASAAMSDEPPASKAEPAAAKSTATETKSAAPAAKGAEADAGPKALSGMSILGNQDAPKALVIVPWKSSQLGDSLGIAQSLDDGRQPVDKDVFLRQLSYYQLRANSK